MIGQFKKWYANWSSPYRHSASVPPPEVAGDGEKLKARRVKVIVPLIQLSVK